MLVMEKVLGFWGLVLVVGLVLVAWRLMSVLTSLSVVSRTCDEDNRPFAHRLRPQHRAVHAKTH